MSRHRLAFHLLLLSAVACLTLFGFKRAARAQTYQPPVGIPAPDFGIEEQWQHYYTRPNPWNQETPGWYCINQYHAEASDNYTYGTPDRPRRTLPSVIPAGSVVEIHGDYDWAPAGYDVLQAEGTATAPVFIIPGPNARILRKWVIKATYTIVERLEFTHLGKLNIVYPSHHVAIRHSNLHHMPGKIGGYGKSDTERVHHIVIFANQIHSQDGWDANPEIDLDNHGIKFGPYVEDVWILENTAYHNGGNFIQVGNWNSPADNQKARRYYIGRNIAYTNRQSPIGIKQSSDVIISENHLYNNWAVQTNAAGQSGIVFQYGPDHLWILNNVIHDSNAGITAGSNSGGAGTHQYIIGNVIYNIQSPADFNYNRQTAWAPAAMMLAGGVNRYIVNNTIFNADGGIHCPGGGRLIVSGNIIANIHKGYHLFIEFRPTADNSLLHNNLFFQQNGAAVIRWGSSAELDLGSLQAQYGNQAQNNLETWPLFADTAAGEFSLVPGSPAIDAGKLSDVYQYFLDRYGLDISRDIHDVTRPAGNNWDIGACEYQPVSAVREPHPHTPFLRIFPNPASEVLNIQTTEPSRSFRIYDITGKVVRQGKRPAGSSLQIAGLPPGLYFLEVELSSGRHRQRFIKR